MAGTAVLGLNGRKMAVLTLAYVRKGGKVLIQERAANKSFRPGYLMAPGGHVEPGESVEETIRREYLEETGLTLVGLRLRGSYTYLNTMPNNPAGIIYLYEADDVEGEFNADRPDGKLFWMNEQDLLEHPKVLDYHKGFLRLMFTTRDHVACMGNYDNGLVEWADAGAYFAERAEKVA